MIVDDEEIFTSLIRDYFITHERGIAPIVTNDPHMVLPLLKAHGNIKLIISDFRMPGISGLELLVKVKEQHPRVRFILMTGFGNSVIEREGLKRGAVKYLEKPLNLEELGKTVKELLREQTSGFGGTLDSFQLPDIIQLIALSRRQAAIHLKAGEKEGWLCFEAGEIVHAVCGKLQGEESFYEMFNWSGGKFEISDSTGFEQRTIDQPWQGLLLEAARRQDETISGEAAVFSSGSGEAGGAPPPGVTGDSPKENCDSNSNDESSEESSITSIARNRPDEGTEITRQSDSTADSPDRVLKNILGGVIKRHTLNWPEGAETVSFDELPLKALPEVLQRHLEFRFYLYSMRIVNTDRLPLEYESLELDAAVRNLLLALRKSWTFTRYDFLNLLDNAVRFEFALSLDPAAAIAEFIRERTGGKAGQVRGALRGMIEHRLIEGGFDSILPQIGDSGNRKIHPRRVENLIRGLLCSLDEDESCQSVRDAVENLLKIAECGKGGALRNVNINLIIAMLEARGLNGLADFLALEQESGIEKLSLEEFEVAVRRHRMYTEMME